MSSVIQQGAACITPHFCLSSNSPFLANSVSPFQDVHHSYSGVVSFVHIIQEWLDEFS